MNIIITGATKGIGLAIAHKFATEGFHLAVNSRNSDDLKNMKKEFAEKYPEIEVLTKKTDMSKKSQVMSFAKFVLSKWKTVDILVNNAGVFLPGEIHKEEEGTLEAQINTNLYSAYHLTRAVLPVMLNKQDSKASKSKGHIFNMCSIASQIAYPNGGSYSISKFALLGFSKVLREEMKDKGIRVTSILPGATWSNSWQGVELPESRLMQASDIATAVWGAWQMSDAAVLEELVIRPQLGDL
ncbi:MAG: SDR family oxidoreductase [Bacteroidota bacterium]